VAQCALRTCGRQVPDFLVTWTRIGTFIDRHWYCSIRCVEEAVRQRITSLPPVEPAYCQGWRAMKLGSLLMQQVGLTRDVIEAAAVEQQRVGTPIGRTLRDLGLVSTEDVLKALATQAGVRYLSTVNPQVVAHRPGELPRDLVRALGIVPIAADARRREMQVACAAPVPGLAVRALTRLTKWAVEPLLVTDETMPQLVELYDTGRGHGASADDAVCDPGTGPRRVAQIARRRRAVHIGHERCDPYVWVRVASEGTTSDVLMSMPEFERGF
jgi:hypothetical protein